jgi:Cu-Zn family superoxide dismutase
MITLRARYSTLAVCVAIAGCTRSTIVQSPSPSPTSPASSLPTPANVAATTAIATIRDASGKQVGTANLIDTYSGVLITGEVSGLGLGAHGFHVHAIGKCEAPFTSAGGHFNPAGRQHGYRNAMGPHLGDLPNLETPAAGSLKFEDLLPGVTLKGTNALLDADGAAIVIHAGRDDYTTDPAGNAGGRIACGVITQR